MRRVKILLVILLSANLVLASYQARSDNNHGDTNNRAPEVYHAETGPLKVPAADGSLNDLSVEATTITPHSTDELPALATNALATLSSAEKEDSVPPLLLTADENGVKAVSRSGFIEGLKSISTTLRSDIKEDPYLPMFTLLRGTANGAAFSILLVANHYSHVSSAVGGMTAFMLSGTSMLMSSYMYRWFNKSKNVGSILGKGFEMQVAFLGVVELAMAAVHAPLFHGITNAIVLTAKDSAEATLSQLPASIGLGLMADEKVAKEKSGENRQKIIDGIITKRNLGQLVVSGYIAVGTALSVLNVPHVDTIMYLALGIPSWIYVGHKENWISGISKKMNLIKQKLGMDSSLIALDLSSQLNTRIISEATASPDALPEDLVKAASTNLKAVSGIVCQGDLEAI